MTEDSVDSFVRNYPTPWRPGRWPAVSGDPQPPRAGGVMQPPAGGLGESWAVFDALGTPVLETSSEVIAARVALAVNEREQLVAARPHDPHELRELAGGVPDTLATVGRLVARWPAWVVRALRIVVSQRGRQVALEMPVRDGAHFSQVRIPVHHDPYATTTRLVLDLPALLELEPPARPPSWEGPRWSHDGAVMWSSGDLHPSVMAHAPGLAAELTAELNAREAAALPAVAWERRCREDVVAELRRQITSLERRRDEAWAEVDRLRLEAAAGGRELPRTSGSPVVEPWEVGEDGEPAGRAVRWDLAFGATLVFGRETADGPVRVSVAFSDGNGRGHVHREASIMDVTVFGQGVIALAETEPGVVPDA